MPGGYAAAMEVSNGGKLQVFRKGNAKMTVVAGPGQRAYGIRSRDGGNAEVTEEGNAALDVGHEGGNAQNQSNKSCQQGEAGQAIGMAAENGGGLKVTRKDKASMSVVAGPGQRAYGIRSRDGGIAEVTEKGEASLKVGHEGSKVQNQSNESNQQGEAGKAIGMAAENGGDLTVTREDEASMTVVPNSECNAVGIAVDKKSTGKVYEDETVSTRVVPQGQISQGRNDTARAEQRKEGDGRSVDAERHQESVMDKKGQYLYED